MKVRIKTMLLLLVFQTLAGAMLWGQVGNRPFVKKFEAGYPNYSYFPTIWPTETGWWGLFTKLDSLGPGAYYYGAESVVIDSEFNVTSGVSYGDTNRYYMAYPELNGKTVPDGKGNFWYWLPVYTRADSTRHLFFGKMSNTGQIQFEQEIPNTTEYDYFFELLPLPGGKGLSVNTHWSRYMYVTWLTWVDSLGNVTFFDSTQRVGSTYRHGTLNCTYDASQNVILAPSDDFHATSHQIYGNRPRISVYSPSGALLLRKDLTSQLLNNSIGSLYRTQDGGYVAKLIEYIYDTTALYNDHHPGIVKLDSNFDVVFKKYLFPPKFLNIPNVFYQSPKGDFYLAGLHDAYPTDSLIHLEWFITKFSPNLDSLWTRFYNLGGDSIHGIQQDPVQIQTRENGDILVVVMNNGYWTPDSMWINYTTLYKLDSMGCLIGGCAIGDTVVVPPDTLDPPVIPDTLWPHPDGGIFAYPNPSNGQFSLVWDVNVGDMSTLRVHDVAGRVLLTQALVRKEQPSLLDLTDWAAGIYLLDIESEKGRKFRTKVMVLR